MKKRNEKRIMIKSRGLVEKSSPNPDANPKRTVVSKLNEIISFGIAGMKMSPPTPNPAAVKMTPMIAVIIKPMNTDAGTFLMYKTMVMRIPISAKSAGAEVSAPRPTRFAGSATIIPAPFKPMNAKKRPIPAPIASFKSLGIMRTMVSLKPVIVIKKKIKVDINTAARAAFQLKPIPRTTV